MWTESERLDGGGAREGGVGTAGEAQRATTQRRGGRLVERGDRRDVGYPRVVGRITQAMSLEERRRGGVAAGETESKLMARRGRDPTATPEACNQRGRRRRGSGGATWRSDGTGVGRRAGKRRDGREAT
ncbi:hypothetical protein DFH09DRAFT_1100077 [Mycena vulgaris]|nr:hypothetical protein DFH09DRAFT_1100077 [Mycena vulgaris]